ncbi:MAG: thioredoxin family protein [Candidatus Thorarchaeota archaeon]|nr:thioredoxin family protein [Candidatus Thorarchaeota archaeon]
MEHKAESSIGSSVDADASSVEIVFFKSDTCAFCPRAEEVLRETVQDFGADAFKITVINVSENPEMAEEFGVFALPTIMIGRVSVTGIPEPEMIMKMILGYKVSKKGQSL